MKKINEGIFETIYYQDSLYTRMDDKMWGITWYINYPHYKEIIEDHTELEKLYQAMVATNRIRYGEEGSDALKSAQGQAKGVKLAAI